MKKNQWKTVRQTKRALAMLLTLVMLLGMLPTVSLAVAESDFEELYLTAYFNNSVTADGVLDESWLISRDFQDAAGQLGALWDGENLYLAVEADSADKLSVTLNETTVTRDLSGGMELALPFAEFGITELSADAIVDFGAVLEKDGQEYSLVTKKIRFAAASLLVAEDCDYDGDFVDNKAANEGSASMISISAQSYGALKYKMVKTPTGTAWTGNGINYSSGVTDKTVPLEVEYTINAIDLPVVREVSSGWRGLIVDLYNGVRYRLALAMDPNGCLRFSAVYSGTQVYSYVDTGMQLGDTFILRAVLQADKTIQVYANGTLLGTFRAMDNTSKMNDFFNVSACFKADQCTGGMEVDLYDLALSKPMDVLSSLTFDNIKGQNITQEQVCYDLELTDSVTYGGKEYPVIWSTSDGSVMNAGGQITTDSGDGSAVTMTATAVLGVVRFSKSFEMKVFKTVEQDLYYLTGDMDPYTGSLLKTNIPLTHTLDQNYNSAGYDLGQVQSINTVVLTDNDGLHKVHEIDLSLYVSDDNVKYTKVEDFDLSASGDRLYLYNFSAQGRYVKVHCTYDTDEGSGFTNNLQDMIWAGNDTKLPGHGGGTFTKLGAAKVSAKTSGEDLTAYLPYSDLPLSGCQEDKRDLRIVLDGQMLPYWLDREGVYVRVPSAEAEETVNLEIWGGNADAVSLSDMDGVFEVTYGSRTITNVVSGDFVRSIAACTAPNGDILIIADAQRRSPQLVMRRSTDGGRTWSEPQQIFYDEDQMSSGGGFLVDNGKIWYFFAYAETPGTIEGSRPLKIAVISSEDNGETWSTPTIIQTEHDYHVTYSAGVKTAAYDGDGPNIDYVQPYHFSGWDHTNFNTSVNYSTDNGETWQSSESVISYGGDASFESGVSEAAITVLSNGDLLLLARCQYSGVNYLAKSISTDNGLTWQEAELSNVAAPNTMPAMMNYEDDILLLWAGNNTSGGSSYDRNSLNLAYSEDDGSTWEQKLDLWAGTSRGSFGAKADYYQKGTQPSMALAAYEGSDDMVVTWWENLGPSMTMLVEDFEDYLYKTKGVADDFESTSAKYDGWTPFRDVGTVELSSEEVRDGRYSLKIQDADNVGTHATRSVPQMYSGEISFDFMIKNADTNFILELKTAQSGVNLINSRIYISVNSSGDVRVRDFASATYTTAGAVSFNEWHNWNLKFDLTSGKAELYQDGKLLSEIPVDMASSDGICFVHIADGSSVKAAGLTAYIDNFRAYEGVSLLVDRVVDMTALQAAIDEAKALNQEDYPADAWTEMEKVLTSAEHVLADPDATQEVVDDAVKALSEAKVELIYAKFLAQLEAAVKAAEDAAEQAELAQQAAQDAAASAAQDKTGAENAQIAAELAAEQAAAAAAAAENAQAAAEEARKAAEENNAEAAEQAAKALEEAAKAAASASEAASAAAASAEAAAAAQDAQLAAETAQKAAEEAAESAAEDMAAAEAAQAAAELAQAQAEAAKAAAENAQTAAENAAKAAEESNAEAAQEAAAAAESAKTSAESAAAAAGSAQTAAEAAKAAQDAQTAAEAAQNAAEEAAASAAEDMTAAEAAQKAAELAKDQAQASKAAAENAQTAAENAAKAAEESNAEAALEAAAAAESAKDSAESAAAAADSAQTAAEAASNAQAAQAAAEEAQAAAEEAAASAAEDMAAAEAARDAAELAKTQAEVGKAAAEAAQSAAEEAAKAAEKSNVEAAQDAALAALAAKASAESAAAAAISAQTAALAARSVQDAQAKVEAAQKAVEEAEENVAADREAVEQAKKEAEEALEQAKKEADAAIEQARNESDKAALSVTRYNALVELNEYADSLKEDASKVEKEALKAAVKAAREAINGSADAEAVAEALQAGIAALDEAMCLARNFTDVDLDEWYHDAIDFALHEGIMNGYGDGTFGPTDSLTRAMLVQILYNIEGRPEFDTEKSFTDVSEGDWYYDAIMWAAENDIVLGYLDGSYGAKDIVTREQMVTILYRYAGNPEVTAAGIMFADSDQISDWAVDAVLWAYENKIVQGVGNKMFDPAGDSQRAAAAQIMMNYFMK